MTSGCSPNRSDAEAAARQAADRLALALEEVGFDVGRDFFMLCGLVDREGMPIVSLGRFTQETADRLSTVLAEAARYGIQVTD